MPADSFAVGRKKREDRQEGEAGSLPWTGWRTGSKIFRI